MVERRLSAFHRQALRRLGNVADAEDAVQDALLSAYTHLDQFRGRARDGHLGDHDRNRLGADEARRAPRHCTFPSRSKMEIARISPCLKLFPITG